MNRISYSPDHLFLKYSAVGHDQILSGNDVVFVSQIVQALDFLLGSEKITGQTIQGIAGLHSVDPISITG